MARRLLLMALLTGAVLALVSCAGKRGAEPADGPSTLGLTAADIADAVPRPEPLARYGNHSPYEVFGRKYYVLPSSTGYDEVGTASWYGSKFHGRKTSSGEPYDMHLATAAHKTLPLPTYAEVTNLENGHRVIVKINDRGPFKDDRLIDLSYGAALRLGLVQTGTARVEVRAIDGAAHGAPERLAAADARAAADPGHAGQTWLQAGAYSRRDGADDLARRLESAELGPVAVYRVDKLFKVLLGPFANPAVAESVIMRAVELGFERPNRVAR